MAGSSARESETDPYVSTRACHPLTAPGTVMAQALSAGTTEWPRRASSSMLAAAADRPLALSALTRFSRDIQTSANRSPPTPVDGGSTTFNAAAVATAASTALPPSIIVLRPAMAARGWLVATIPFPAKTVDRLELNLILI